MKIAPFKPLLFREGTEHFHSQPFDTISRRDEETLKSYPHNITHITLPESDDNARRTLEEWKREGVLSKSPNEMMLAVEQRFLHGGKEMTRKGILCLVDVFPVSDDIKPHELTFPGPRKGRFMLMRAIRCMPEPIFLITPSAGLTSVIDACIASGKLLMHFEDPSGVDNRIFEITDAEKIGSIQAAVKKESAIVADGHHRLAAVREMAQEMSAQGNSGWNSILAYVTQADPDGLLIAGIHRIVANPPGRKLTAAALGSMFGMSDTLDSLPDGRLTLYDGSLKALYPKGHPGEVIDGASAPDLVNSLLLRQCLAFSDSEIESSVRYTHDAEEAKRAVDSGEAAFALLMPDWAVNRFTEIVSGGKLLPQKSTFFYPKIPSGIALYEP